MNNCITTFPSYPLAPNLEISFLIDVELPKKIFLPRLSTRLPPVLRESRRFLPPEFSSGVLELEYLEYLVRSIGNNLDRATFEN